MRATRAQAAAAARGERTSAHAHCPPPRPSRAQELYKRDEQYIVEQDAVAIVDEFTGRVLAGRRWGDGLQQAVEASEGVSLSNVSQVRARARERARQPHRSTPRPALGPPPRASGPAAAPPGATHTVESRPL